MDKKKIVGYILFGIFLFSLIRLCQYYLILRVPQTGIFYLDSFLGFKPYYNSNLAFGIPFANSLLIVINTLIIILLIDLLWRFFSRQQTTKAIAVIFILVGAFSNLIERVKYGYVLDFFHLWILPIFNLADFFIITGVIWLVLIWYKEQTRISY